MVTTGLTRNFWKLRPFRPLKMSTAQGFARVRISQFHIVLACCLAFFQNRIYTEIHGELSERSKVRHSKSPSANGSLSSEKPLTVRVSGVRPPQTHREF